MVTGTTAPPADAPDHTAVPQLLTVGVEEEYLLVDPVTGKPVAAAEAVFEGVPPQLRGQVQYEFLATQLETASAPVVGLDALARSLTALRRAVAESAERAGARLVAVGTAPLGGAVGAPVVDLPRFHRLAERFGALTPDPGLNGLHVHVGIADREVGVQVLNHLRPWLPLLHAATANSPYFDGRDTGYASWRSILWSQWPSVGPAPYLRDAAHYDTLVARLVETGALVDDGMLYWYGRLSRHLPTVELRLGDVCPTVGDSILLAALTRALVATVLEDVEAGRPAPPVPSELLIAAHWRAAHDGLEGQAVDPVSGRTRPAWHVLRRLVDLVTPALDRHGDLAAVTLQMGRLRARGTGAARQRAVVDRHGAVAAVVPYLVEATLA